MQGSDSAAGDTVGNPRQGQVTEFKLGLGQSSGEKLKHTCVLHIRHGKRAENELQWQNIDRSV